MIELRLLSFRTSLKVRTEKGSDSDLGTTVRLGRRGREIPIVGTIEKDTNTVIPPKSQFP